MFGLFKPRKPLATLAANPAIFPGDRDGDRGKIRMSLELVFDTGYKPAITKLDGVQGPPISD
jgi:hypothetical protein